MRNESNKWATQVNLAAWAIEVGKQCCLDFNFLVHWVFGHAVAHVSSKPSSVPDQQASISPVLSKCLLPNPTISRIFGLLLSPIVYIIVSKPISFRRFSPRDNSVAPTSSETDDGRGSEL